LLVVAPFLWALGFRHIEKISFSKLWLDKKYNRGPLVLLEVVRVALCILIIGFLLNRVFSVKVALPGAIIIIVVAIIFFSKRLQSFYSRIEHRFLANLNSRESEQTGKISSDLIPWDGHLTYFDIAPEADWIGKTLLELGWREQYGVNVALIERGHRLIQVPTRDERLYPADRIAVIGTDEQLDNFSQAIANSNHTSTVPPREEDITLTQLILAPDSPFAGKSIRESDIRNVTAGLVVGVERHGERQLNPDSSFVLQPGDAVWIVGNRERIKRTMEQG
jgi:CPA2 family monovalent cation:H+ antiporter-2